MNKERDEGYSHVLKYTGIFGGVLPQQRGPEFKRRDVQRQHRVMHAQPQQEPSGILPPLQIKADPDSLPVIGSNMPGGIGPGIFSYGPDGI